MHHSLFISDLHLCPTRPRVTHLFLDFLENVAMEAEALYVLGDLFEYWAGDDNLDDAFNLDIANAFARLADHDTAIYFMHGNRDFLVGNTFAQACHFSLLSDPTMVMLYGTPTLLMHGDTLCTDDTDYQAFRTKVRDPAWQAAFLAQPLVQRKATIEALRRKSEIEKQLKPSAIMDVNSGAVNALLEKYGYPPRIIHGHTHRPALHTLQLNDKTCERWVLPAWEENGGYLRCDATGCKAFTTDSIAKLKR
jgi:UDP-2,3-diacylglucosamine hydrolase